MAITYRIPTEADWDDWVRITSREFLGDLGEGSFWADVIRPIFDFDRGFIALDGEEMVGKTHAVAFEMSVPGGSLSTAGVTGVTVAPTHRRRGILTELMRLQLDDLHERDEPLAALLASESLIYGRFGYGLAVPAQRLSIDRRHTAFHPSVPEPEGEVRFVTPEVARESWPALYDQVRATRPAMLARDATHWTSFSVPERDQAEDGFGKRLYVEYTGPEGPEGYAIYNAKSAWPDGIPSGAITVRELVATTTSATAALWRYLFGIDLVETITARNRPLDDPLHWMLADPRRLKRTSGDHLWLRILDVPRTLEGRSYTAEGRLVLDVHDPFGPWAEGRFELVAEGGVATCRPTNATPDVTLAAADLAACYLGGASPAVLAQASRIEGAPEAIQLADTLLASPTAPWCPDDF